jgi:hypothetical protein
MALVKSEITPSVSPFSKRAIPAGLLQKAELFIKFSENLVIALKNA